MIKAEIFTPMRRYVFEVPDEIDSLQEAHTWLTKSLKGGRIIHLANRIIDIRDDVKGIDVYEELTPLDVLTQAALHPAQIALANQQGAGVPREFNLEGLAYLGNRVDVSGYEIVQDGVGFILPYEVNGQPALDVVSREALAQLLETALEGATYKLVIPVLQPSNAVEAQAYLMDYIAESTPPKPFTPGDKTARAAGGLLE